MPPYDPVASPVYRDRCRAGFIRPPRFAAVTRFRVSGALRHQMRKRPEAHQQEW